MTNLNPAFLVYATVICLVILDYSCFQAIGLVIAASNMPMHRAATLSILLITYFFGWSGLLMDMHRLPVWISWAGDLNVFRSAVNLMFRLVTGNLEHSCGEPYSGGDVANASLGCEDGVISPAEARLRMGILREPLIDLALMGGALVLCRLFAYILLRRSLTVAIDGVGSKSALPESSPAPTSKPKSADEVV